jgi:hypothetical protein
MLLLALVILHGQPLPGGVLFNILNSFSMNNNTQVAFDAGSTNMTTRFLRSQGIY